MQNSLLVQLACLVLLASQVSCGDSYEQESRWLIATNPDEQQLASTHARHLLQASYVSAVCDKYGGADSQAVINFASKLVGDPRITVVDARYKGACIAFGMATLSPPHALAPQFSSALVLSTGDAAAAGAEASSGTNSFLSTDLHQAGDSSIGSYTYDAAILEIDLAVLNTAAASEADLAPVDGSQQLVFKYMFGSDEYGSSTPNPDVLSIRIKGSDAPDFTDISVLPGGAKLPPPGASSVASPVQVYANAGRRYNTVLNGFSQVSASSTSNTSSNTVMITVCTV
jgi:hypothetical protein